MGLLSALGRGARRLGDRASFNAVPWTMGLGAAMGGASAAGNGGDMGDIGRSALIGGAMGGAGMISPGLGVLGALGASVPGAMSTRGDVDAAARKIVAASRGDPRNIERAADLLYGADAAPEEMGYGRMGRSNYYGVSASDRAGMGLIDVERQQAVQRAYELMGAQP